VQLGAADREHDVLLAKDNTQVVRTCIDRALDVAPRLLVHVLGAIRGEALERQEEPVQLAGRDSRIGVGDRWNGASRMGARRDLDPAGISGSMRPVILLLTRGG
jgi:hypothetical protein